MTQKRQARRCRAKRSNGQPCRGYAINGGDVCAAHGGKAPQVKAAAAQSLLEERARRVLGKFSDAEPVLDSLSELQRLAGEAAAWKQFWEERVRTLREVRYESAQHLEQLRSEVLIYERAQATCVQVNAQIARLNVDDRLVAIQQRVLVMLAGALRESLAAAGLDREQQQAITRDFARRVRLLKEPPDTPVRAEAVRDSTPRPALPSGVVRAVT